MKFNLWLVLLSFLCSAALAQETSLYVVDVGPNRGPPWQVLKYDENGQNPEVFITAELSRPQDIVFLEDEGTALVSNLQTGRITKYDAATGAYLGDFATGIGQPTRMEIGADNLLYVLQWGGNGRVWRYDLSGNFVDEFTSVGVTNSIGLDWDGEGNLYVASFDAAHVRKFDSDGNDLGLFITSGMQGPTNIWFDGNGNPFVVDWTGRAIRKYTPGGSFNGNFTTGLNEPEGIEFLDNGHLLVGNGGTSSVRQYDANGTFVKDFIPSGLGGLAKPNALRFRSLSSFQINAGLSDAWFYPPTNGQGFFVNVWEDIGQVFIGWFTYDVMRPPEEAEALLGEPGHRWLTAQGTYSGDTASLDVYVSSGGIFDSPEPPVNSPDNPPVPIGTMEITWKDCNTGEVRYSLTSPESSGVIPIERISLDNIALCEALAGQ
jgi:hypothetical protein